MRCFRLNSVLGCGLFLCALGGAHGATVGFRGDGSGRYKDAEPPRSWSDTNGIAWCVKMPSWSNASPVPVGDKVLTCAEPCLLVCVNAADGAIAWQATNDYAQLVPAEEWAETEKQREAAHAMGGLVNGIRDRANKLQERLSSAEDRAAADAAIDELAAELEKAKNQWQPTPLERQCRLPGTHGGTGYSTPTPVSDGRHVWAVFGNGVAACYTLDGRRVWIRLVEKPTQGHGHSASPLLADGKLIVSINSVHALNPATGEEVWNAPTRGRFGTPAVVEIDGAQVLVTPEGQLIRLSDGSVVLSGMGGLNYNGPVSGGGRLYFVNDGEARAFKMPTTLDGELKPEQVWKSRTPGGRLYASPVLHDGLVYCISDRAGVAVLDAATGEQVGQLEAGLRGTCYTSLAIAGDCLVAGSEEGDIAFLKPGRECALIGKAKVDKLRSTPAFDGKALYVRTMQFLYRIGN